MKRISLLAVFIVVFLLCSCHKKTELDFGKVIISSETSPYVVYDGENYDEKIGFELEYTEISIRDDKTVKVPDNCYIYVDDWPNSKHVVNKTPICAVLYDKGGETNISINDKRLIAMMNFYNYDSTELVGMRFQSQGQITDNQEIFKEIPRLVITYADPSKEIPDMELMQIVVRAKEYDLVYKDRNNVAYPEYGYDVYSVTPYGDLVFNDNSIPQFLQMFGFID